MNNSMGEKTHSVASTEDPTGAFPRRTTQKGITSLGQESPVQLNAACERPICCNPTTYWPSFGFPLVLIPRKRDQRLTTIWVKKGGGILSKIDTKEKCEKKKKISKGDGREPNITGVKTMHDATLPVREVRNTEYERRVSSKRKKNEKRKEEKKMEKTELTSYPTMNEGRRTSPPVQKACHTSTQNPSRENGCPDSVVCGFLDWTGVVNRVCSREAAHKASTPYAKKRGEWQVGSNSYCRRAGE